MQYKWYQLNNLHERLKHALELAWTPQVCATPVDSCYLRMIWRCFKEAAAKMFNSPAVRWLWRRVHDSQDIPAPCFTGGLKLCYDSLSCASLYIHPSATITNLPTSSDNIKSFVFTGLCMFWHKQTAVWTLTSFCATKIFILIHFFMCSFCGKVNKRSLKAWSVLLSAISVTLMIIRFSSTERSENHPYITSLPSGFQIFQGIWLTLRIHLN